MPLNCVATYVFLFAVLLGLSPAKVADGGEGCLQLIGPIEAERVADLLPRSEGSHHPQHPGVPLPHRHSLNLIVSVVANTLRASEWINLETYRREAVKHLAAMSCHMYSVRLAIRVLFDCWNPLEFSASDWLLEVL